jgi:hypothetical protein
MKYPMTNPDFLIKLTHGSVLPMFYGVLMDPQVVWLDVFRRPCRRFDQTSRSFPRDSSWQCHQIPRRIDPRDHHPIQLSTSEKKVVPQVTIGMFIDVY